MSVICIKFLPTVCLGWLDWGQWRLQSSLLLSYWVGNKDVQERKMWNEVEMRQHVVCSLTLFPSCPYNLRLSAQEGSFVVVSILLPPLPLIWWNHTESSRSCWTWESIDCLCAKSQQSENLNRFTRRKTICIFLYRELKHLLNLAVCSLSVLQDFICSL